MKPITKVPGTSIYENLLVISPHEELWNKIMVIKEKFADTYKSEHARWGKPHLTIANFVHFEMMVERFANKLRMITRDMTPFKILLNGFGTKEVDNIHIVNATKEPVRNLVQDIEKKAGHLMTLNEHNKPHFIEDPHITIGRKLTREQFDQAWLEYQVMPFEGQILADSLIWLKRPVNTLKYQIVKRFDFQKIDFSIAGIVKLNDDEKYN